MASLSFALIFALVFCAPFAFASVEVDQHTLAKLVGGSNSFFVQVIEHSWDRAQGWEEAAREFLETPGVVVATLVTSEEDNAGSAEKYGVTSYPTFLFFHKGESTPEVFKGAADSEEAFDFLKSKLAPELRELQALAATFTSASDKKAVIAKAQSIVDKMDTFKQNGELFVKTMQRVAEKGSEFVTKEQTRLSALTENEHTVEKQKKDFRKRLSVLRAFKQEL